MSAPATRSSQTTNQYLGPCPYRLPTYRSNLRYTYTSFAYASTLPLTLRSLRTSLRNPESPETSDSCLDHAVSCLFTPYPFIRSLSLLFYCFNTHITSPYCLLTCCAFSSHFHHSTSLLHLPQGRYLHIIILSFFYPSIYLSNHMLCLSSLFTCYCSSYSLDLFCRKVVSSSTWHTLPHVTYLCIILLISFCTNYLTLVFIPVLYFL